MPLKKNSLVVIAGLFVAATAPGHAAATQDGGKIHKCQDATGKWHYGDTASEACAKSKITIMSEQGIAKREIAPPPTEADLQQRADLREQEERAKEQAKHDELLLSSYAHEADVLYVRDRKLSQLESLINASEETLKSLRAALARMETQAAEEQKSGKVSEQTTKGLEQTRAQITKHEAAIATKRKEQDVVRARAETDLARYRELKKAPPPAASKKP
ncbi:MAG: hypothetical protein ACLGHO_13425 [Gammaproteobacteria bacterium]